MATTAATSAVSSDQAAKSVWLQIEDPKRPTLIQITKEIKKVFEDNGWSGEAVTLQQVIDYLEKKGQEGKAARSKIGSLQPTADKADEKSEVYGSTEYTVIKDKCALPNPKVTGYPGARPTLIEVTKAILGAFEEKGWAKTKEYKKLKELVTFLEVQGKPGRKVRTRLATMQEKVTKSDDKGKVYDEAEAKVISEYCGYRQFTAPVISKIEPAAAKQGETVTITLSGQNLPANASLVFEPADGLTLEKSELKDGALVLTVKVADGAALGDRKITLANKDDEKHKAIKGYDQLVAVAPQPLNIEEAPASKAALSVVTSNELTDAQKAARLVHEVLKLRVKGEAGYENRITTPQGQQPAADSHNLGLTVSAGYAESLDPAKRWVNLYGRKNALVESQGKYELQANFLAQYRGFYHTDARDTNIGGFALNFNNRLHLAGEDMFNVDGYAGYRFNASRYAVPTRFFYNGREHELTGGLALNSSFGTSAVLARAYTEVRNSWFNFDAMTSQFGQAFDGTSYQLRVGGELATKLSDRDRVVVNGYGTPAGRIAYQENMVPGSDTGYQKLRGYGLGGSLQSDRLGGLPAYAALTRSVLSREDFADQTSTVLGVGVDLDKVGGGRLDLSVGWAGNVSQMYGGQAQNNGLKFTLDKDWFKGADAFAVTGRLDSLNGQRYGGGYVEIDLTRIIWPTTNIPTK